MYIYTYTRAHTSTPSFTRPLLRANESPGDEAEGKAETEREIRDRFSGGRMMLYRKEARFRGETSELGSDTRMLDSSFGRSLIILR